MIFWSGLLRKSSWKAFSADGIKNISNIFTISRSKLRKRTLENEAFWIKMSSSIDVKQTFKLHENSIKYQQISLDAFRFIEPQALLMNSALTIFGNFLTFYVLNFMLEQHKKFLIARCRLLLPLKKLFFPLPCTWKKRAPNTIIVMLCTLPRVLLFFHSDFYDCKSDLVEKYNFCWVEVNQPSKKNKWEREKQESLLHMFESEFRTFCYQTFQERERIPKIFKFFSLH